MPSYIDCLDHYIGIRCLNLLKSIDKTSNLKLTVLLMVLPLRKPPFFKVVQLWRSQRKGKYVKNLDALERKLRGERGCLVHCVVF